MKGNSYGKSYGNTTKFLLWMNFYSDNSFDLQGKNVEKFLAQSNGTGEGRGRGREDIG